MKPCNQCGKCCIAYADGGLSATPEEIDAWNDLRPDIARFVRDGRIWCDPDSGEPLAWCPWLRSTDGSAPYHCAIYSDRPEDCRAYPVLVADMVRDDCEMLEPKDRRDPRAAQRTLDRERGVR